MVRKAIPAFHLKITEKDIPGSHYMDVEWLNPPEGQRKQNPSTVVSPLNQSYKDPQEIGRALYQCLFEGKNSKIGAFFQAQCQNCADPNQEAPGLRLIMDFVIDPGRPNRLINLPWELLRDDEHWLVLDRKISLVRRFNALPHEDGYGESQGIEPPMRVVFAYAEPKDKPCVQVKDSIDIASQSVESAVELLKLEVIPHVTAENLKSHVKQGAHLVHWLGHGDIKTLGMLFLEESETPTSDVLTAREFGDWVKEATIKPKLIVLMACHSGNPGIFGILGFVTRLLDAGVESVVSMQTTLYTDEARDFTTNFYRALVSSSLVDAAVCAGRQALKKDQSTDDRKLIYNRAENEKGDQPLGRWHPISFTTFISDRETQSSLSLPAWSIPTLYLHGEGWLGLELPPSLYAWPKDQKAMIYVEEGRFYMDKYPVTRGEYRKFARKTNRPIPHWEKVDEKLLEVMFGDYFKITDAIKESWETNLPATNITVADARAYAAWAHKHLPTPDEWQQAALSGCAEKSMLYPWGNNLGERMCNTLESHFDQLLPVTLSGEYFKSCSAAGVCDVVGNASEWAQAEGGQTYVCGGSYRDWGEKCTVQTRRLITNPSHTGASIGFRCAASQTEWMAEKLRSKSESEEEY